MTHNRGRTNALARPHGVRAVSMWLAWMWLALVGLAPGAAAQSHHAPVPVVAAPGTVQELELRDGSRLYGRIESVGADTFVFRMVTGVTLVIPRSEVTSLRATQGDLEGQPFVPADPNATRLFFAPTGRSLPRGDGYAGVYQVLLPFVQFGVTDRFSVGGGTPLFFGVGSGHPIWLTPKVQLYASRHVQAAAGVMHVLNVEGHAGVAYGVVTVGSGHRAISAGVGWGYTRADEDHGDTWMVMIAAEHRASRRVKWITENYVFQGGGIVSGGVRLIGDRLSADVALAAPLGVEGFYVWPLVNFVWTFQGHR